MIRCWPVFKAIKKPAVLRIGRVIKRAGGVAVSKPAIIGWTCMTVALIPPLFVAPAALPAAVAGSTGAIDASPWAGIDTLPLPTGWEIIGPPVLLPDMPIAPDVPTAPGQPVPEPSSIALLAAAIASLGVAHRVINVRADGVKLPHGGCGRSLFKAQRTARLLAVTNADPAVDHFAVSDGKRIVFRAPSNGRDDHA